MKQEYTSTMFMGQCLSTIEQISTIYLKKKVNYFLLQSVQVWQHMLITSNSNLRARSLLVSDLYSEDTCTPKIPGSSLAVRDVQR